MVFNHWMSRQVWAGLKAWLTNRPHSSLDCSVLTTLWARFSSSSKLAILKTDQKWWWWWGEWRAGGGGGVELRAISLNKNERLMKTHKRPMIEHPLKKYFNGTRQSTVRIWTNAQDKKIQNSRIPCSRQSIQGYYSDLLLMIIMTEGIFRHCPRL